MIVWSIYNLNHYLFLLDICAKVKVKLFGYCLNLIIGKNNYWSYFIYFLAEF